MPVCELRGTDRRGAESTYLSQFSANVTSADGEDGIIARIFELMPPSNRHCLEVGAHDGHDGSNTWSLINRQGWRSLQIEADPYRFSSLSQRYVDNPQVNCLNQRIALTGENCMDQIVARAGLAPDMDLLSLDVDGLDWHIWNSMETTRPRVLLVEFNHTAPNDVVFIQDPDANVNQGASLRAFIELGRKKGYELIATTLANAFFVVAEEFPRFGIADNGIDAMYYNEAYWTHIFQGFDGTLFLAGFQKLIWKNMLPFSGEDIQPLPRSLRKY